MNYKLLGLVALLAGPVAASAQVTTLYYQGDFMTGGSSYLPTGLAIPSDGNPPNLPGAPVIGAFTASLTVDGSVGANDLNLVAYSFNFNGSNGVANFSPSISLGPAPISSFGTVDFNSATGNTIILTTLPDGTITGATVDVTNSVYHASFSQIEIGSAGDSFSYHYSTTSGGCENVSPGNGGVYTGETINPCAVSASNKTAGGWLVTTTQAPEIDPATAASGLTLLLAGLAVMRGRRKVET